MNVVTIQNNEIVSASVDNETATIPDGRYVRLEDVNVEASGMSASGVVEDIVLVCLLRTGLWLFRFKGDPRKSWDSLAPEEQKMWLRDAKRLMTYQCRD